MLATLLDWCAVVALIRVAIVAGLTLAGHEKDEWWGDDYVFIVLIWALYFNYSDYLRRNHGGTK